MLRKLKTRFKIGFTLNLLAAILLGLGGLNYLFSSEFKSHHSAALGQSWSEVEPAFQVLFMSLMKPAGGAWFAISVVLGIILLIPYREGQRWAIITVPSIGILSFLPALYATYIVTSSTPATAPVGVAIIIIGLFFLGLLSTIIPEAKETNVL